jgi:hypothetical protein
MDRVTRRLLSDINIYNFTDAAINEIIMNINSDNINNQDTLNDTYLHILIKSACPCLLLNPLNKTSPHEFISQIDHIIFRQKRFKSLFIAMLKCNPDLSLKNNCNDTVKDLAIELYKYIKPCINHFIIQFKFTFNHLAIRRYVDITDRKIEYSEYSDVFDTMIENVKKLETSLRETIHDVIYMMNNVILLNQTLKSAKMGGNAQMLILEYIVGDEKIAADIVNANKPVSSISNL